MRLCDSNDDDVAEEGVFDVCRTVTLLCRGTWGSAFPLPSELFMLAPGRGRGGIVVGLTRGKSEGGGIAAVLDPRDDRFTKFVAPGPVERFKEIKPEEGMGNNVGVAGRELGVGMELVVVVLPAESRDCGRRNPVIVL